MVETAQSKHARVHLRLDARSRRKLERAAAYEETTISQFVLSNAVAAAERVIEAHEKIPLSAMDWGGLPRRASGSAETEHRVAEGGTALSGADR